MACEGCLRSNYQQQFIGPWGDPASSLMLVVSPRQDELEAGRLFVDGRGRTLANALAECRMRLEDVYAVPVFHQWVDGEPTPEQLEQCHEQFLIDRRAWAGKCVLYVGGTALFAATGNGHIGDTPGRWRGYRLRSDPAEFATFDPAFVQSSGFKTFAWFSNDVRRAVAYAHGKAPRPFECPPQSSELELGRERYALDIETRGFLGETEKVGYGWDRVRGSVLERPEGSSGADAGRHRQWSAISLDFHEQKAAQRTVCESPALKIIQNAPFDVPHLHADGIDIRGPYWDTMYAMQLIDPDSPGFSLEEIAAFVLDMERWKHLGAPKDRPKLKLKTWKKEFKCARCNREGLAGSGVGKKRICKNCTKRDHYKTLEKWNLASVLYNRTDAAVLLPIQEWQRMRLAATGQLELFENMMEVLEYVLIPMQERGLRVDKKVRAQFKHSLGTEAEQHRREWKKLTGGINPQSNPQLRKHFYEKLNCPVQYKFDKKTKTRKIAFDAAAIEELRRIAGDEAAGRGERQCCIAALPALDCLQKLKRAEKWYKTYCEIGDRIYPRYGPAKKDDLSGKGGRYGGTAATGRIIAKGGLNLDGTKTPPIQQFPEAMKTLILPDHDVFVALDYAQQELRICAYMSGCDKLIKMIEEGQDIHAHNSKKFGCDRTRAKNLFYGAIFGAAGLALVHELRSHGHTLTIEEANAFVAFMRSEYPEIFAWHDKLLAQADRRHYVEDAFGARRYFYTREKRANEIVNFPIQSSGARMQWLSLRAIYDACERRGCALSILQFDSVVISAPREEWRAIAAEVKAIMEQNFAKIHPDFRNPVDVKMGPSWGEMKEVQV